MYMYDESILAIIDGGGGKFEFLSRNLDQKHAMAN